MRPHTLPDVCTYGRELLSIVQPQHDGRREEQMCICLTCCSRARRGPPLSTQSRLSQPTGATLAPSSVLFLRVVGLVVTCLQMENCRANV